MLKLKIKLLDRGAMPTKASEGAVCYDAYAKLDKPVTMRNGTQTRIPLGFAVEVPQGYELLVRGRSGLTSKGVIVWLGTVDQDYRGEVQAMIMNLSGDDYTIENGDRICQIALRPLLDAQVIAFQQVDTLDSTERGAGGFGHTGK